MTDTDWKPISPCPKCCEDANDPNQEKCRLYAYDLDCEYLAKYQGEIEGQKRLLGYQLTGTQYLPYADNPTDKTISLYRLNQMLKQLEELK